MAVLTINIVWFYTCASIIKLALVIQEKEIASIFYKNLLLIISRDKS